MSSPTLSCLCFDILLLFWQTAFSISHCCSKWPSAEPSSTQPVFTSVNLWPLPYFSFQLQTCSVLLSDSGKWRGVFHVIKLPRFLPEKVSSPAHLPRCFMHTWDVWSTYQHWLTTPLTLFFFFPSQQHVSHSSLLPFTVKCRPGSRNYLVDSMMNLWLSVTAYCIIYSFHGNRLRKVNHSHRIALYSFLINPVLLIKK